MEIRACPSLRVSAVPLAISPDSIPELRAISGSYSILSGRGWEHARLGVG